MPKVKATKEEKVDKYVHQFPQEFRKTKSGDLGCVVCNCDVNCHKLDFVKRHQASKKHIKNKLEHTYTLQAEAIPPDVPSTSSFQLNSSTSSHQISGNPIATSTFNEDSQAINESECYSTNSEPLFGNYDSSVPISERVTRAFLAADIPLHKLRNNPIRSLFKSLINCPCGRQGQCPSENTCRRKTELIYKQTLAKVKFIIENNQFGVFLIFDETTMFDVSYTATLIGTVDNPQAAYLVSVKELSLPITSIVVQQILDDDIKKFNIERKQVRVLISDAAPYMVKAGKNLKPFYNNMMHITCTSHLLHNCGLKIRASFKSVDTLIAAVKTSIVKNKSRRNLFISRGIPIPPSPVVTRWGTWLKAALYYAKHFNDVEEIFSDMSGGKLVSSVKDALSNPTVFSDLTTIATQYSCLENVFEEKLGQNVTVSDAHSLLTSFDFGEDVCNLRKYIEKRLQKNDIIAIVCSKNHLLSSLTPFDFSKLQNCQATSYMIERLFSMLRKLLAHD